MPEPDRKPYTFEEWLHGTEFAGSNAPAVQYLARGWNAAMEKNFQWVPAGEGEPPVTDTRFAVLLISGEEVDFTSDERIGFHFLRPHYPGAKKPIPADCRWLLLPPIPEGS